MLDTPDNRFHFLCKEILELRSQLLTFQAGSFQTLGDLETFKKDLKKMIKEEVNIAISYKLFVAWNHQDSEE